MRVRAKKCDEDGVNFDSLMERERYRELRALQKCGEIADLKCHPLFRCIVANIEICKYTADFSYVSRPNLFVVEDVKGFKKSKKTGKMLPRVDRGFRTKMRLMKACFGIEVRIV